MVQETGTDIKLLAYEKKASKFKTIVMGGITGLNFLVALAALGGCLYLVSIVKTEKQERIQILQSLTELQKSFQKYKAETIQLPDNLEIVLQDLTDQIKGQKNTTRELESLIVSDFKALWLLPD